MKAAAKRAEIPEEKVWLHKFRATAATKLLQAGMPLRDVMLQGGWRDLESVQRNMGLLTEDRLRDAVEAAWT